MLSVDLLIYCLDGADLTHFTLHGGAHSFPSIGESVQYRRPLQSTVVPQTPVAWMSFICGLPPEQTGVWGWHRIVREPPITFWDPSQLPSDWNNWGMVPTLLAGLPLTPNASGPWGRSIAGIQGPTSTAFGSRPSIDPGITAEKSFDIWFDHHAQWSRQILTASASMRVVAVHCDSVDWYSHRFGPSTNAARFGWVLAELLLRELLHRLSPKAVMVLSDHGSCDVKGFVLIHNALFEAGLSNHPGSSFDSLDDLVREPVFCASDYGALWCRDPKLVNASRKVLSNLGAKQVSLIRTQLEGSPSLVPDFGDGWLALVPPKMYSNLFGFHLTGGPIFSQLKMMNWMGDHSREGIIGANNRSLWQGLSGVALHDVKSEIIRWLTRL